MNDDLLSSIFWFNLLFGFTVAIIIVFIAPIIAGLFDEPRLTFVLWAIAGAFPIGATGLVHQAILEREKKFKPVAIVEVASVLLGLICGVLAANYGVGAYSLVAQSIVTALVTSMGMWRISIWRPKIGVSIAELRSILGFSSNLLGFNFINYFARNADGFLIGRLLGANDLGVYTIAYRMMLFPLQNISSVVSRVLFPVFSRWQHDTKHLSELYLSSVSAISLVVAPCMFGLFVVRANFVEVLLGPGWEKVAVVLMWLAPVGLLQAILTTVGTLYLALGETKLMLRWGGFVSLLTVVGFMIGIQWGLLGMLKAYAVLSVILFIPSLYIPTRMIGLSILDIGYAIAPSFICALMMAVSIYLVLPFFKEYGAFGLIAVVIIGALLYFALIFVVRPAEISRFSRVVTGK